MLSTLDHIVAATLAGARSAACDYATRDEYLAEYEAFLALMTSQQEPAAAGGAAAAREETSPADRRHIPCTI